ncbi:MAG: hypothetical protein Ct9H300mP28_15940 [Pseudomonadota bacterium]|nr:MAG: hypothetical protein Ct9H300mP28_15940 [Pseudomonadota bacterium]
MQDKLLLPVDEWGTPVPSFPGGHGTAEEKMNALRNLEYMYKLTDKIWNKDFEALGKAEASLDRAVFQIMLGLKFLELPFNLPESRLKKNCS